AVAVLGPGESSRVHDGSGDAGAVSAHVFGQGMHDDVGAPFDGAAQGGRGHRVVHDQRHAVAVGGFGQGLDVDDVACRVADGFAEHRAGAFVDHGLQGGDVVVGREADFQALARESVVEQVVGAAVELAGGDDVVS